jgi:hypothetical protein
MNDRFLPVQMLVQSGRRFAFSDATVCLDSYLFNSVQELDNHDLVRQITTTYPPEAIVDADCVLITDHLDHCDPYTLLKLAQAFPQAKSFSPGSVVAKLPKSPGANSPTLWVQRYSWEPSKCMLLNRTRTMIQRLNRSRPRRIGDAYRYFQSVTQTHQLVGD